MVMETILQKIATNLGSRVEGRARYCIVFTLSGGQSAKAGLQNWRNMRIERCKKCGDEYICYDVDPPPAKCKKCGGTEFEFVNKRVPGYEAKYDES